jgi:hypothetical protein
MFVINSMEQCSFREANCLSASEDIPRLLWSLSIPKNPSTSVVPRFQISRWQIASAYKCMTGFPLWKQWEHIKEQIHRTTAKRWTRRQWIQSLKGIDRAFNERFYERLVRAGRCKDKAQDSYSGGTCFESRSGYCLPLRKFSFLLNVNARLVPPNKPPLMII